MAAEVGMENASSIPKHVVDIFNAKFGEDMDNMADVDDFLAEYMSKENILAKAVSFKLFSKLPMSSDVPIWERLLLATCSVSHPRTCADLFQRNCAGMICENAQVNTLVLNRLVISM